MTFGFVRCLAAASLSIGLAGSAAASTVTIRYTMTLAGLPIGNGSLNAALLDNGAYKISVSAKVGGILTLMSDARGTATASGRIAAAQPDAGTYALNSVSSGKQQTVQMALAGGAVTDVAVTPPVPFRPDRVEVTASDKRGVIDPLSAMLMPVPGGDVLGPAACRRNLPVFDGAQRFDVTLSYARTETVTARGYSGPVIVCSARYTPIAGHRPAREQTRFMAANRDLEVWLAPVAGTHVLAPARIIIGTQVGRLQIIATTLSLGGAPVVEPIEATPN